MKGQAERKYEGMQADASKKYEQGKHAVVDEYKKAKSEVESAYDATKVRRLHFCLPPISLTVSRSLQHTAEDAVEKVKGKSSSWLGWGSSKADETKKDAAAKVEQGADQVKSGAQKRQ